MPYDEQYCLSHNQRYGAHLRECPICVGEKVEPIGITLARDCTDQPDYCPKCHITNCNRKEKL